MKVLALDYGSARTGVAVSDPTGTLARPLCTVEQAASDKGLARLRALVRDEQAERVVVGLPLTLRGEVGAQAEETSRFVERLRALLDVPVEIGLARKAPADRTRFDALVAGADMLVTNVSASRLPEAGLSPDTLRERNPALVFTYLNLYGVTGPWAGYKGYAEIANCAAGVSALTAGWATAPSGAPPVNSPPWPYTDSLAGVLGAFGSVAALYDRGRRGRTYRVNTSLAQTALLEQMPFAVDGADVDPARGRDTSSPAYRIYDAADGPVFVAIAADDIPEALRRLGAASPGDLGTGDLGTGDLGTGIASRTAQACVRALCFGRSAASPVETPSATMAPDSSWARRGLRLERPSEDFGTVVTQAPVARFTRTPAVAGDTPRIFGTGQPDGWTGTT